MSEVREDTIEQYLVRRVKKAGGVAEKFTSPGRRAVPDRLVTLPGGRIFFVECKAPGKTATENQRRDHERRRAMGCTVYVVDTKDGVDEVLQCEG